MWGWARPALDANRPVSRTPISLWLHPGRGLGPKPLIAEGKNCWSRGLRWSRAGGDSISSSTVTHCSRGASRSTFLPSAGLCGCLTLAELMPDPLSTDCACSPGSRPAVLLSLRTLAGASLQLHAFRLDSFGEEKWKAAKVRWENCSFSTRGDFIRAQLQLPGALRLPRRAWRHCCSPVSPWAGWLQPQLVTKPSRRQQGSIK